MDDSAKLNEIGRENGIRSKEIVSESFQTSEEVNIYFASDSSENLEGADDFSITQDKIRKILDKISLETGELTKIYIEDFSGDDISLNNKLKDSHISKVTNGTVLKTKNDEEITETRLSIYEKEGPLFVKGRFKLALH